MFDQELKDKFYSKYYSFLEETSNKIIKKEFYVPKEGSRESSYYFRNREEFNKILSILINFNFKKKTFKKDAFFTFLENEYFGLASVNTLEKNLVHQIQMEVDIFMTSKYNCFFRREDFYQKNNPFKSNKEFHFFIISKILENIEFNPHYARFSAENEFYLLEEYFDKVMLQLKQKFDSLETENLHREVIRLEILKDKYHFYFLNSSIKKIEKLIDRLNSRSDKIKEGKDKLKLNISPQKLSKLYVLFFENNNTQINEEKIKRINQFISNCFVSDSKYSAITNTHYNTSKSIDFLVRKNFNPFIAVLIFLIRKKYIGEKRHLNIQNILLKDLKEINKEGIGLSTALRGVISKKIIPLSDKELIKLTKFNSLVDIKNIIKY
jgi:hypothetical protein